MESMDYQSLKKSGEAQAPLDMSSSAENTKGLTLIEAQVPLGVPLEPQYTTQIGINAVVSLAIRHFLAGD